MTVPVPPAVALAESSTVEPVAEMIVVPVGIPAPETNCPAVNPAMLETPVMLALSEVVVPVKLPVTN